MNKAVETAAGGGMIILWAGYVLGPVFGLYAAVVNGSFLNAVLSLILPYYGLLYWGLS